MRILFVFVGEVHDLEDVLRPALCHKIGAFAHGGRISTPFTKWQTAKHETPNVDVDRTCTGLPIMGFHCGLSLRRGPFGHLLVHVI